MRTLLFFIISATLITSYQALAQTGKRSDKVLYERATVGTTAQAATSNANKSVHGWQICHEVGSGASYISLSEGADPDTDGLRLAPGVCFDCVDCGFGPLNRLRVKGQAAGAPYAIVQRL